MICTSYDLFPPKDVPFIWGLVHTAPHFREKSHKTPILGAWISIFKLNAQNIKICVSLLSRLLHRLQPNFAQWQRPQKQIQDGGRPPTWKVENRPYLRNGYVRPIFAKFGTIDAPNRTGSWNFQLLKTQDGRRPPFWKMENGHRTISINVKACSCQKCHTPSRQK